MRYGRTEHGVVFFRIPTVILKPTKATFPGLWSGRAILGRSAGRPTASPTRTRQTENCDAAPRRLWCGGRRKPFGFASFSLKRQKWPPAFGADEISGAQ